MQKKWFTYQWIHNGNPSITEVDLSWRETPEIRSHNAILCHVVLNPKKQSAADKPSSIFHMRLQMFVSSLTSQSQKSKLTLVGKRNYAKTTELFFYGHDQALADQFSLACYQKWLDCRVSLHNDARWEVYEKEVLPNTAQFQCVQNQLWAKRMQKSGDDIRTARRINHYATFPNEIARTGFEMDAKLAGFVLGESFYAPENPLPHSVCVRNMGLITEEAINAATNKLIGIIEKYGGQYQYWDCAPILRVGSTPRRSYANEKTGAINKKLRRR